MLAVPLNCHILLALEEGPTPLSDLRRSVGHPPLTTMRSYLRRLTELGLIVRHREDDFPGSVSYALAEPGQKLLAVGEVLQDWLAVAPEGPLELGSTVSKSAVKALVDGWSTGIIRALAARPLALTELNRVISQVSYPTLERRLTAMRQVGLVEPCKGDDRRVTRCEVTPWLRGAVAPLAAGVGWEAQCLQESAPAPGRVDVETVFLLAVPLLALPSEIQGRCRLAVEFRRGADLSFAGVTVDIFEGKVRSCVSRLQGRPDAWVTGGALDWFRLMEDLDDHRLELGGDPSLANGVADGLRSGFLSAPRG